VIVVEVLVELLLDDQPLPASPALVLSDTLAEPLLALCQLVFVTETLLLLVTVELLL
jgi:hypothetical protein